MTRGAYPEWEAEVLDQSYESVDYISLHKYWNNYPKDTLNYLASHYELDEYIGTVRASSSTSRPETSKE